MPGATLETLRAEFKTKHARNKAILDAATDAGRDLLPEEKTESDTNFTRLEEIRNLENGQARLAQFAHAGGQTESPADPLAKKESEIFVGMSPIEKRMEYFKDPNNRRKYKACFNAWAAAGVMLDQQFAGAQFNPQLLEQIKAHATAEQFATVTTATQSGILLPKAVMDPIVSVVPNTFRQAAQVVGAPWAILDTDSTANIAWPVMNGSAGGKVTETANSETEAPPAFNGSFNLTMSMYQSNSAWFGNLVINANAFDIVQAAMPQLYYQKELGFESDIATTMYNDSNITQTVTTNTSSGFLYTDLVSFNRKLPKRYGFLKCIILNKAAYTAAENLTTTTGFPILNQDAQNSELKRFNGTPVLWTDYFNGFGSGNIIGCVISLLGFRLRDCDATNLVQRYTQVPSRPAQTGFNLFAAHAFGYDPSAVAMLKCP